MYFIAYLKAKEEETAEYNLPIRLCSHFATYRGTQVRFSLNSYMWTQLSFPSTQAKI